MFNEVWFSLLAGLTSNIPRNRTKSCENLRTPDKKQIINTTDSNAKKENTVKVVMKLGISEISRFVNYPTL